ncbi:sigma-54 interaction domain-containing protein [Ornithinibacillus salinisoli]|uniref:Sigma-54 interaction domain-containing protein n=1 Tax=Ornithinibacillus salinisoli TaxID=1848459 RepID=A0ABW4VYJ8_9BACI
MGKNRLELLVVAYRNTSLHAIINQLHDVGFTQHCNVRGILVDQMETIYTPDLTLATSEVVYQMGKKCIQKDTPYIIARRSINFARIKQLLSLPKGSRVYLVNNMKDAAEEAINTLLEVGINHTYVPYYGQETPDPSITVAVTPGEVDLVPNTIKTMIDIGNRLLDMSTLYEVYEYFGISTFASNNQLTARYIHSTVSLVKELNMEINQSQGLQKSLEGIVDQIEEGLIVYDQFNQIISINSQASELLGKTYMDLISEDLSSIPTVFYNPFMQVEMEKENFIEIENTTFYIRKKRILVGSKVFATIILFQKMNRIKSIETNYRIKTQKKGLVAKHTFSDIRTNSATMLSIIEKAKKMARSDSTIFIYGETGTGKEVMAQAIHSASNRSDGPFVAVNLAAVPESLVESELFGYEKGAFTGASQTGSMGLFERAHQGTIFLDEIGDASPTIQNRLLRVLQEREIQRVGGGQPIPIDVRVITATNKDLKQLINEGKFREDLFYRLNILPIPLLPIRNRKEDILLLCELFAKEFEEKLQREPIVFSKRVIDELLNYEWPGNVREIRNTIEYISHISEGEVTVDVLPSYIKEQQVPLKQYFEQEDMIYYTLTEKGFLQDCQLILTVLVQLGCKGIGRKNLLKLLANKNPTITEQMLRYRMELLSEMNLIEVGQGRKGSFINSNGERFLSYLEQPEKRSV